MKKRLLLSLGIGVIGVSLSCYIATSWIAELYNIFGIFSWVMLFGVVFIPCFYNLFVIVTLLFNQRNVPTVPLPTLSIMLPVFNEEDNIIKTIMSILEQDYLKDFEIIVVDDGSTDNTASLVQEFIDTFATNKVTLVENVVNKGKASALNSIIDKCRHDVIVTVDSDTILHKGALKALLSKFVFGDYDAVAGSIRVGNHKTSLMTRLQKYDYLYGIASVKQSQGLFDTTLVAQGAFSCYKKEVIKRFKWCEVMGEDIVLSWNILSSGGRIGYEGNAVAFTNAPETYAAFFRQRKRWSIGLIEAFRRSPKILTTPSYGLPYFWNNLFFVYIDICYLVFFIPSIIAALFFGFYLMAGVMTLLLIPLGLILTSVIMIVQKKCNREIGIKSTFNLLDFLFFLAFYQVIQTPACLCGYIVEAFKIKKRWGSRQIR